MQSCWQSLPACGPRHHHCPASIVLPPCRVPFFIRGPGLKQAVVNSGYGSHVDLAATLVSLAGGTVPHTSDGQPLPLADSAEEGTKLPQPEARYDR